MRVISHLSQPKTAAVAGLLFGGTLIGYFLIAAPWRYPKRILETIYAITDQRALVYRGFGWSLLWLEALPDLYNTLCSFDPRQVRARRSIARYQGRIDLVFGGENLITSRAKGKSETEFKWAF